MAQVIGVVSHATGTVTAMSGSGNEREVSVGGEIFDGEVISTKGSGSGVNITFNTGCAMSLGENESSLIDETVYKLEYFDNVDVVVDLDSMEEIADEVATSEDEDVEYSDEVNEVFLAGDEEDVDELETAAGEEEDDNVVEEDLDIAERLDSEDMTMVESNTNTQSSASPNMGISHDIDRTDVTSAEALSAIAAQEATVVTSVASTATILDSVISGLEYESSQDGIVSYSGLTDEGKFNYTDGDTITFNIGGIVLGSVVMDTGDGLVDYEVDKLVFLQDLLGLDRNNLEDGNLISLARLLQTLDEDTTTNDIDISAQTRLLLSGENITDLSQLSEDVLNRIADLTGKDLVSIEDAIAHMSSSLDEFTGDFNFDPTISIDATTNVSEDGETTISFNTIDINASDEVITTATATNGTVTVEDGVITYTPNADFNGSDTISLTADDGAGGTATTSITVTVDPVNDAPTIEVAGTTTVDEDSVVTGQIEANDIDNDNLTFSVSEGTEIPQGLTLNQDGSYEFDASTYDNLDLGNSRTLEVPITVTDTQGGSAETILTIDVEGLNNDLSYVSESAGYSNVVGYYLTDADGNPTTATVLIDNQNGMESGTYLADLEPADYEFFIIANGASLVDDTSEITFDNSGDKPILLIDGEESAKPVYFTEPTFNPDNADHFIFESDGNGGTIIKIEDLPNLGDNDFNDVVLHTNFEMNDINDVSSELSPIITNVIDADGDLANMTLHGTGTNPGNTITIYNQVGNAASDTLASGDYAVAGTAIVQADGTWSFDISSLSQTTMNDNEFFKVMESDATGNSGESDATHYWHGTWSNVQTENQDDFVAMGSGNDRIRVNDNDLNDQLMVDGGDGKDTAIFSGSIDNYTITADAEGDTIVTENANLTDSDSDGTGDVNEFRDFESIKFGDTTLDVSDDDITVDGNLNAHSSIDSGYGNDDITVAGNLNAHTSIDSGYGNDNITVDGSLKSHSSIDAGEGKDTVTINGSISSNASIDGGEGEDTLVLDDVSKSEWSDGVKDNFEGFENITLSDASITTNLESPLSSPKVIDLDALESLQSSESNQEDIGTMGLKVGDVMEITDTENTLKILNSDTSDHTLSLDSDEWQAGETTYQDEGGNLYDVYSSVDTDNQHSLLIDEMITVTLENS